MIPPIAPPHMNRHLAPVRPSSRKAFTLVEVMLASMIAVVVISGVLTTFLYVNRLILATYETTNVNAMSRLLHERFLYDIRSIIEARQLGNSGTKVTAVDPATGTSAALYQEFTCQLFDFAKQTPQVVRFYYDSARKQLRRSVGSEDTVVMSGIDSVSFRFFDRTSSGQTETSTPTAVTMVRIDVLPSSRKLLVPGTNRPFATAEVQLRNIKKP